MLEQYQAQLEANSGTLLRAARLAGLDVGVPTCPDWHVRQLVQHVVQNNHRIAWLVMGRDPKEFTFDMPGDGELFDAFERSVAHLLDRLSAAPDSIQVWTPMPSSSSKLFWNRRAAHEVAIHRVDAELACGYGVSEFDAAFAADGVDEFLMNYVPFRFASAGSTVLNPFSVTVTPLDANSAWSIKVAPSGVTSEPQARDDSDLSVFGLASDLYRWVWNRAGDDEVSLRGDVRLSDTWRETFRVGPR